MARRWLAGREVVVQYGTDLNTARNFSTDANGREMQVCPFPSCQRPVHKQDTVLFTSFSMEKLNHGFNTRAWEQTGIGERVSCRYSRTVMSWMIVHFDISHLRRQ